MNASLLIELNDFLKQNNLELQSTDFNFITSINWKTPLQLKCLKCNHIFTITTKQLLRPHPERLGIVCPRCNGEDIFIKKLISTYGKNPYNFISKFESYNDPLTVECKTCGYLWTTPSARNLLINKDNIPPCKCCANKRNYENSIDDFKETLKQKFGNCDYEFFTPQYQGKYSKKKMHVKCKICGYEFDATPQNLLNPKNGKHYCKNCNKILKVKK